MFEHGFGLSVYYDCAGISSRQQSRPAASKLTAILAFLNMHPDLVGKYIDSILAPSDRGDVDCLAVLGAIFTLSVPIPQSGHLFCIGSHSVSFQIEADTPDAITALTLYLHSGVGPGSQPPTPGADVDMALVNVMKHWKFPASIVSALEAEFVIERDHCERGWHLDFRGSPGKLTCTVYVKSCLPNNRIKPSAQKKHRAATGLFCYFNRHVPSFSAECKTLVRRWDESLATVSRGVKSMRLPAFQQSLKALEKHTAAGPMLEAWEAESLCTVPLKPYQSQSVKFMSDAEHNPRGLQSAFWLELCPGNDAAQTLVALFSPVTGEIIVDGAAASQMSKHDRVLPPGSHGGFLFEAMGLGKTVEMIALMAKNPPPPAGLPLRLTVAELAALPPTAATGKFQNALLYHMYVPHIFYC